MRRLTTIAIAMTIAACNMLKVDDDPAELAYQPPVQAALKEPTACNGWPLTNGADVLYYDWVEGKSDVDPDFIARWPLDHCAEWTSKNDGTLDVGQRAETSEGVKWNPYSWAPAGIELTIGPGAEKTATLTIDGTAHIAHYVSTSTVSEEVNNPLFIAKRTETRPTCQRTLIDLVSIYRSPDTFYRDDFMRVVPKTNYRLTWLSVVLSSTCDEPIKWICRRSWGDPVR